MKHVEIYTDGACTPNPGRGGYGVVLLCNGRRRELSQGFELTTNNRMELLAVIEGLAALKEPCNVTIYSDSQYVVCAYNDGWLNNWIKKSWRKVKNVDLWQRFLMGVKNHNVKMVWVRGHTGVLENERCDVLAVAACCNAELFEDKGYTA